MYFLTFQPEYVPRLCLNFNKSQHIYIYIYIYAYKDYAYKTTVTMYSKGKEKKQYLKDLNLGLTKFLPTTCTCN